MENAVDLQYHIVPKRVVRSSVSEREKRGKEKVWESQNGIVLVTWENSLITSTLRFFCLDVYRAPKANKMCSKIEISAAS